MYSEIIKGYEILEDGTIISYKQDKNGRELRQCLQGKGYLQVSLNGKSTTVHRLVAWKYCVGYIKDLTVNHIDGNKLNNHKDNLEWISVKDNCVHAMKNIRTKRRLYNDDMICEIRSLSKRWKENKDRRYTNPKLAKMFGVSKVTIGNILNGKRYSYVNDKQILNT